MNNNLKFCQYGKHHVDIENFTVSGLRNIYNICRTCNNIKARKYRQKYKKSYNEHHREYLKRWRLNKKIIPDLIV